MQASSGEKQKSSYHPSNATEVERVQPSNATRPLEVQEATMQSNQQDLEFEHHTLEVEHQPLEDDGWEGEDYGDGLDGEDIDGAGTTQMDSKMTDGFLHGEENRQFRSKVWNEFTKIRVAGIVTKARCVHCNTEISTKCGAGTGSMSTHLKRCKVRRSVSNVARRLRSAVMSPEGVALDNWRFSQEVSRRELNRMITLHGLPLSLVDYDGFRRFVSSLNPVFKMISRRTISDDVFKVFQDQKQKLSDVLEVPRVEFP